MEEGEKRWNLYCEKQRYKNTFEAKKEKFGWSKEEFDKFNKSRAVTLENLTAKHGQKIGLDKWKKYCDRQAYTNSIDYFIEKYGEEGHELWLSYNQEKAKSYDIAWTMKKYNTDENGAAKIISKRHKTPKYFSKSEKEFVDLLEEKLGESLRYTINTRQFCIWNKYINSSCFYDITCTTRNKIIEFHKDYWHCNPEIYHQNYSHRHSNKLAKEIWNRDYLKKKSALDRGFQIKVVWWSEFKKNKSKVIEECAKWMNTQ